jgi:hypothetical protein
MSDLLFHCGVMRNRSRTKFLECLMQNTLKEPYVDLCKHKLHSGHLRLNENLYQRSGELRIFPVSGNILGLNVTDPDLYLFNTRGYIILHSSQLSQRSIGAFFLFLTSMCMGFLGVSVKKTLLSKSFS